MEIYIFAKLIYALYVKAEKDFLTKFKFFWILNNKKNDVHLNSSLEEKIYKYFFFNKNLSFFLRPWSKRHAAEFLAWSKDEEPIKWWTVLITIMLKIILTLVTKDWAVSVSLSCANLAILIKSTYTVKKIIKVGEKKKKKKN